MRGLRILANRTAAVAVAMATVVVAATLLAGCSAESQGPVMALQVAQADEALGRVREDAARHAPDLLADVEKQMAATKTSLAMRRYKEVERDMAKLGPDLQRLIAVTQERRNTAEAELDRAAAQWNAIVDEVPQQIATLQQRVDAATRSGRPPSGMTAERFEDLKQQFEAMKRTWAEADQAVTDLRATEAATLGQQARDQGAELLEQMK